MTSPKTAPPLRRIPIPHTRSISRRASFCGARHIALPHHSQLFGSADMVAAHRVLESAPLGRIETTVPRRPVRCVTSALRLDGGVERASPDIRRRRLPRWLKLFNRVTMALQRLGLVIGT